MSAINQGIEIGRRALQSQQAALNVTGHNIANANTPGFSRRKVNLESAGNGNGVDVSSVVRQRSQFLDAQIRVEQQLLGRWETMERALGGLEAIFNEPAGAGSSEAGTIFNEPSGVGFSGSLSRFWNAWQDLANVPESGAARAALRQEAEFLTTNLHQYHAQLHAARLGLDDEAVIEVNEINDMLDQLAEVNGAIVQAKFGEENAGDLEDQRDRLLDELSLRVDITTVLRENGQVSVLLSGHNLVEATKSVHLETRQLSQESFTSTRIFFSDDGSAASIREGRLRGIIEVRDQVVPDIIERLDDMVAAMVDRVNALHNAGFGRDGTTGVDFFNANMISASNIVLDDTILDDLDNIAASGDGNSGDNGSALAISSLRNEKILAGGSMTVEGFYNELIGEVGARSKEAQTMASNHRLFSGQIENRRQSIQGVSLNDEASQLVLFQRAYQAAARTVSIIDDLMEVTINI